MAAMRLCAVVALPWLGGGNTSGSGAPETRTANVLHFNLLEQNWLSCTFALILKRGSQATKLGFVPDLPNTVLLSDIGLLIFPAEDLFRKVCFLHCILTEVVENIVFILYIVCIDACLYTHASWEWDTFAGFCFERNNGEKTSRGYLICKPAPVDAWSLLNDSIMSTTPWFKTIIGKEYLIAILQAL